MNRVFYYFFLTLFNDRVSFPMKIPCIWLEGTCENAGMEGLNWLIPSCLVHQAANQFAVHIECELHEGRPGEVRQDGRLRQLRPDGRQRIFRAVVFVISID